MSLLCLPFGFALQDTNGALILGEGEWALTLEEAERILDALDLLAAQRQE